MSLLPRVKMVERFLKVTFVEKKLTANVKEGRVMWSGRDGGGGRGEGEEGEQGRGRKGRRGKRGEEGEEGRGKRGGGGGEEGRVKWWIKR